jgi:putative DNA primase/helicase
MSSPFAKIVPPGHPDAHKTSGNVYMARSTADLEKAIRESVGITKSGSNGHLKAGDGDGGVRATPLEQALEMHDLGYWAILEHPDEKRPIGEAWGLERWSRDRILEVARHSPRCGAGACFGPGRAPGGSWIWDLEGDGPGADQSRNVLLGSDTVITPTYRARRGIHTFFADPHEEAEKLLALLREAGAKEGKGRSRSGVFHLDEFPGLEFRLGGFKRSGVAKQCQSVVPPSTTDGFTRVWLIGPATPLARTPDSIIAALEDIIERKAIQAEQQPEIKKPSPFAQKATNGETWDMAVKRAKAMTRHDAQIAFARAALQSAADTVAAAGPGTRHNVLLTESLPIAGFVNSSPSVLTREEFLAVFHWANKANGHADKDPGDAELVLESALAMAKPRDLSQIGLKVLEMDQGEDQEQYDVQRDSENPPAAATATKTKKVKVNEAVDDPHAIARSYLNKKCRHEDGLTLRFYKDEFFQWERSAYRPVPTKEVNADLNRTAKAKFDEANKWAIEQWKKRGGKDEEGKNCRMPQAKKVGTRLIGDVNQALTGLTLLKSSIEPAAWLKENPPFDAREVIPCRNAFVHLPSLASGQSAIVAPTPAFFGTYALNYDFNADAPVPIEWLTFLRSLWPNDPECIDALQEFFGYCLTGDTRQQKLLSLIGPKRAGKDTIVRILRAMIGPDNVAGPTLSSLATNFGLWPLINKPLAIISDARLSGRSDIAVIVERILTITGESTLTIDRKNREPWTGKLGTRLVIVSNEMPKLSDASGALVGRFILLKLTQSFYGREDKELFDRLVKELPGILLWAIEGWRRLNFRGHFLQPKSGRQMIVQMEDIASPVGAFVREKCEFHPEAEILTKDLFEAWRLWCESMGRSKRETGDAQNFGRHLAAVAPQVFVSQPRRKDSEGNDIRVRVHAGIELKTQF